MASASTPNTSATARPTDPKSSYWKAIAAAVRHNWKTVAAAGLFVIAGAPLVMYALLGGSDATRCTTEYGTPAAPTPTIGGATAAPSLPPTSPPPTPTTATPPPARGPAGLAASKQTCTPIGLADPPLAVLGLVFLLLAVPALRITQLGFAGMTLTHAVTGATDAARSASQAADRAATAALTVASAATARSSAGAAASGNITNVYPNLYAEKAGVDLSSVETVLAFTLAANGVAAAVVRGVEHVSAAVVLWRDTAKDSLRPHSVSSSDGMDMRSPLGDVVRRGQAVPVTITEASEVTQLGLDPSLPLPAEAAAISAGRRGRPTVGLILVVLDTAGVSPDRLTELRTDAIKKTAPFALPATVIIERLTTAGAGDATIEGGGR